MKTPQQTLSLTALLAVLAMAGAPAAIAETPEEKGLRIMTEAEMDAKGFGDSEVTVTIVLRNRHGEESARYFRIRTLEQADDGDKTLSVFVRPPDVRGTALLTHTHKVGDDDIWLYLPALKRVKRISSSNQSGSFVGSEFAYEDLGSQEVEKYTYRWLRDESCPGAAMIECTRIERFPVNEHSGYTRHEVWSDHEYRPWRVDFYDRKNTLLKTLTFDDYRIYLDRYWRAHILSMVNHQTGKSTDVHLDEYIFQQGFSDRDFDRRALSRAR